jgi:TPP-dependent 2-oxoacid decarboxylase
MATNGVVQNGTDATVKLGRYLWERIHQVGVNHVFGVPGDFNLTCKSITKYDTPITNAS